MESAIGWDLGQAKLLKYSVDLLALALLCKLFLYTTFIF